MRERGILIGLLVVVLLLVGCGGPAQESGSTDRCDMEDPPLYTEGVLTVATDKPAYKPWFKGPPGTTRATRATLPTRSQSAWTSR